VHADPAQPKDAAPPEPAHARRLTLERFLTDGSLARLCAELTHAAGLAVELRDADGALVLPGDPYVLDPNPPAMPAGAERAPLVVDKREIGAIWLAPGVPESSGGREPLLRALHHLAAAASEVCTNVVERESRIQELDVLYRLTSSLVRASSVDRVIRLALDSAIDVLGLDAGSVVLIPEDAAVHEIDAPRETRLRTVVSRGLSEAYISSDEPLSFGRLFDRLALDGEIVMVPDVTTDDRVDRPERVTEQGLRSFINAGLVFQGRPIGLLRLYGREVRVFGDAERRLLVSIGQQAALAVEQARLLRMQEEERRIARQLEIAADVQRRMLPEDMPSAAGLTVAARYVPSFELGGDFYDAFELESGGKALLALTVGDVVGKGVPAALLMSAIRATLRAHADGSTELNTVVERVNQAMCRDTLEHEFATLWFGLLDPETRRLAFTSAGHDPPYVIRVPEHRAPTVRDVDELFVGGMAVGIDPSQRYQVATYDLRPGDALVAYSDGLPDARSFSDEKLGKPRLRDALLGYLAEEPGATADQIADHVMWVLRQFTGLRRRVDDQTLLVVRANR
jgi:sigma-B regulation protein RsbU (phosphoserine phosphatase)